MFLIRWILKITGIIPALFIFYPKVFFMGDVRSTARWKGPAVIAMNHRGFCDYIIALILFPFRRMDVVVGQAVYDSSKILRFALKVMGAIPVSGIPGDMSAIDTCIRSIRKGRLVLVFPEGRIETDENLHPYRQGAALIAAGAQVPVIPIYHDGQYGLTKRGRCFVGSRIYPVSREAGPEKTAQEITDTLFTVTKKYRDLYYQCFFGPKEKKKPRPSFAGIGYLFIKYTGIPLIRFFLRPKVILEHEAASVSRYIEKRLIICCNHTWWMDLPVMYDLFWRRSPRSLAALDVAEKNAAQKYMQSTMGCIFLNREGYDWGSIRTCIDELNQDGCICVCPEGRLNFGKENAPFQKGAAMMAVTTGASVVPVYINSPYLPFRRTRIILGEPVLFDAEKRAEGIEAGNAFLEQRLADLRAIAESVTPPEEQKRIEEQREFNRKRVVNFGKGRKSHA